MVSAIPVSPRHMQVAKAVRLMHKGLRGGKTFTPELLADFQDLLKNHQIEMHATPSPCPGTARRGSKGASPKQLSVIKAFRYGRHHPLPSPEEAISGGDDVARRLHQLGKPRFDLIFAGGANRSGKTVSVWGSCFCQHLRDHAKDKDLYWCIAPDFTKLRQGPHKWLSTYLPRSMFGDRSYSEKMGFGMNPILELTLPDGRGNCTVVFKTEEQKLESFESDSVNGIAWTEATRETIYDAILSRIVDTDGFILVDYLPDEAWHKERFEANTEAWYQHFCMMDNAHNLPPGAVDKARSRMTKEEAAVRIDGKNRAAFGVVIKEFIPDYYRRDDPESGHLVRPFLIPADWPLWIYTDVGKYTATLLLTAAPDGRWYVVDEVYTVAEMYDTHIEGIDAMLKRNGRGREDVLGGRDGGHAWSMDPAAWNWSVTNEKNLGELYIEQGLPYQGWVRTATIGETAMLEYMRLQFTQFGLLVFDRCVNLIKEIGTWKHNLDKDGRIDPNERYTGPNHAIDALKAWSNSSPAYGHPDDLSEFYSNPEESSPWPSDPESSDVSDDPFSPLP